MRSTTQQRRGSVEMSRALRHLAGQCEGGGRPNCPIIDSLATGPAGLAA